MNGADTQVLSLLEAISGDGKLPSPFRRFTGTSMHDRWEYEPDEKPKRRHHWDRGSAGFVETSPGILVGKCPSDLDLADAEAMLNDGIPWSPRGWDRDYPERIYAIRDGILYRATRTNPGKSYHGFPETARRVPEDRKLRTALLERARQLGCEAELERWLRR